MKVIKVTKKFRNGIVDGLCLVNDDIDDKNMTKDEIDAWKKDVADDVAGRWAERESGGHCYGYTWEWESVYDLDIIRDTIEKEIRSYENQIERAKNHITRLKKYL